MHVAVVISGIPGSGKSTLARSLQPLLGWSMLDKDDYLDALLKAVGAEAGPRRRELSRTADAQFQRAALATDRAVLVSFWHVAGMRADSGTPTAWLTANGSRVIGVHCECAPSVAAARFLARVRDPGHGDAARSEDALIAEFTELAGLGAPPLPASVSVRTDRPVDAEAIAELARDRLAVA